MKLSLHHILNAIFYSLFDKFTLEKQLSNTISFLILDEYKLNSRKQKMSSMRKSIENLVRLIVLLAIFFLYLYYFFSILIPKIMINNENYRLPSCTMFHPLKIAM